MEADAESGCPAGNPWDVWRDYIVSLYPNALTGTYSVPPLHFNKVPYRKQTVLGTNQTAFVVHPPADKSSPTPDAKGTLLEGEAEPEQAEAAGSAPEIVTSSGTASPPAAGEEQEGSAAPGDAPSDQGASGGGGHAVDNVGRNDSRSAAGDLGDRGLPRGAPHSSQAQAATTSSEGKPGGKVKKKSRRPLSKKTQCATRSSRKDPSEDAHAGTLWCMPTSKAKEKIVQGTDNDGDFSQNHVVTNLQALGDRRKEAMFILSEHHFEDYLNKSDVLAEAAQLPGPSAIDTSQTREPRGEADIVLLHRRHGVLLGEIKAVGRWHAIHEKREAPDSAVVDRLKTCLQQLFKSEKVVRNRLSDIAPGFTVRKTVFLPFVNRVQLTRVLAAETKLLQDLCQCLEAGDATVDAVLELCVYDEQLSDPDTYWHVTQDTLGKLTTWWEHRMATDQPPLWDDKLYLDIVARFVGPASTVSVYCIVHPRVEVRTAGQAVAELGRRLSYLVLTEQQMCVLTKDLLLVCITGPPGTGKTVLLALKALQWLRQGLDVHIVSVDPTTVAATRVIEHQLQVTLALSASSTKTGKKSVEASAGTEFPKVGAIHVHQYDFNNKKGDEEKAVNDLIADPCPETLCVIMDEIVFSSSLKSGQPTLQLVQGLKSRCHEQQLRLWCAGVYRDVTSDAALEEVKLTIPMRFAPVIFREVTSGFSRLTGVESYTDGAVTAPGDGLKVIHLHHDREGNGGHRGRWPVECETCGLSVANQLYDLLGITTQEKSRLSWRDVFIITRSAALCDDVKDEQGLVTSPACGLVRGLREAGVPVNVLSVDIDKASDKLEIERRMTDIALAKTDQVNVVRINVVHGLERRVVVWLVGRATGFDDSHSDEYVDARDRLFIVSRCTTQLIVVGLEKSADQASLPGSCRLGRRWSWPPPPHLQQLQRQPSSTDKPRCRRRGGRRSLCVDTAGTAKCPKLNN